LQDNTEISRHSGQILKFQEFQEIQDNAQPWIIFWAIRALFLLSNNAHNFSELNKQPTTPALLTSFPVDDSALSIAQPSINRSCSIIYG